MANRERGGSSMFPAKRIRSDEDDDDDYDPITDRSLVGRAPPASLLSVQQMQQQQQQQEQQEHLRSMEQQLNLRMRENEHLRSLFARLRGHDSSSSLVLDEEAIVQAVLDREQQTKSTLVQLNARVTSLQRELDDKNTEMINLHQARDNAIQELQTKVDMHAATIVTLETKHADMAVAHDSYQAQLQNVRDALRRWMASFTASTSTPSPASALSLVSAYRTILAEYVGADVMHAFEESLDKRREQVVALQHANHELATSVNSMQSQLEALASQYDQATSTQTQLQEQYDSLQQHNAGLTHLLGMVVQVIDQKAMSTEQQQQITAASTENVGRNLRQLVDSVTQLQQANQHVTQLNAAVMETVDMPYALQHTDAVRTIAVKTVKTILETIAAVGINTADGIELESAASTSNTMNDTDQSPMRESTATEAVAHHFSALKSRLLAPPTLTPEAMNVSPPSPSLMLE
jgi:hypothetical protein